MSNVPVFLHCHAKNMETDQMAYENTFTIPFFFLVAAAVCKKIHYFKI